MWKYCSVIIATSLIAMSFGQETRTTINIPLPTVSVPGTEGGWPPIIPGTDQNWPPPIPGTENGWPPPIPGVNGSFPGGSPSVPSPTLAPGVSSPNAVTVTTVLTITATPTPTNVSNSGVNSMNVSNNILLCLILTVGTLVW
ncbi:hypothetical protein BDF19DRAFT_448851 [Syncephalis fuscata]|nr:hypothetical protein BDF19DRAFT_448851 [Syncephalis fuscata]